MESLALLQAQFAELVQVVALEESPAALEFAAAVLVASIAAAALRARGLPGSFVKEA